MLCENNLSGLHHTISLLGSCHMLEFHLSSSLFASRNHPSKMSGWFICLTALFLMDLGQSMSSLCFSLVYCKFFEIVFVKSNNSFYLPMTRKMFQLPLCLRSSNYVLKLHLIASFSHHEEPYDLIYQGGCSGIGPENALRLWTLRMRLQ